jgi:xanthine/uracil permease
MTAANYLVQIIVSLAIPLSLVVVWANRAKTEKGIGVRTVQFVAAGTVMPTIIILALNGKIGGETSAALIGAFIGYLFANISNFDKSN